MLGSIAVTTLVSSLFALSVARPCDTTNVAPWMENSGRLSKASLFSSYVGDYLIQVFKFPLTPIESVISREKVGRGSFSSLACEEAALAGPGGAGGAGWACWV